MAAVRARVWLWVLLPLSAWGQAVAVGAGYSLPAPIDVAPGQVITLYVRVPGKTVASAVIAQPPLPAALGGFSVMLRQTFPTDPLAAPILGVADYQSCSPLAPTQCDVVSMVTVQIPFLLTPNVPRSSVPQNFARLDISYQGNPATTMIVNPVTDRIHVVSGCDVNLNSPLASCTPLVKHGDGTAVTAASPAAVGENLTISAVGLGVADQDVATGAASPQPAVPVSSVVVAVDARANVAPGTPYADTAMGVTASTQLLPGAVGIYQVSFTVPALPAGTPACSSSVLSNLTVSVGRVSSYDGVAICADPSSGQQKRHPISERNVVK